MSIDPRGSPHMPPQRRGRRGIPTWALSIGTLLGLAAVAVAVLIGSMQPPGGETPAPGMTSPSPGSMPAVSESGGGEPVIAGTVSVAPELTARASLIRVLFIVARKGAGPPFAVTRIVDPTFPLTYRIGQEDVMTAGTPFEGEVSVSARLSATGSAGPAQPGDLEGEHPGRVKIGAQGVDILISRVR